MKTVRNKTNRPLRVPLPRGRVLHLGPNQTGQVADLDHPPLQKMIDAKELEVVETDARSGAPGGPAEAGHESTHGHLPNKVVHKSGDR